MRRRSRGSSARWLLSVVAAIIVLALTNPEAVGATSYTDTPARLDPWLASTLRNAADGSHLTVLVHGTDVDSARSGALKAGLTPLHDLKLIGVAVATGDRSSILRVAAQPGVTYIEGDRPLEFFLDRSQRATRGSQASTQWRSRHGVALDGRGVSVAVIDSGVDPTHPFFRRPDGKSVVVANLKNFCGGETGDPTDCFVDVGAGVDTDTASASGHGTHVNGIIAGQPTKLADGVQVAGAAPGARLVSLSVGAANRVLSAELALSWVLEHHAAPCGPGVPKSSCPPIKVINNSWGPGGGGNFDSESGIVKLQRKLAAEGVVIVWANGNDGGTGNTNRSNPPGQDPKGGIISVASYFDRNTGTRNGSISTFSSRGDSARPETWPDISAPGEDITSSCRPYLWVCSAGLDPQNGSGDLDVGAFNTISGTSMAAPHIAGIVAQLFQAQRLATPAQMERALKSTAHRYSDGAKYRRSGRYTSSYDKGTGLVDVVAAVNALRRISR